MPDPLQNSDSPPEGVETSVDAIDSPGLQSDRVKELQQRDPSLQELINYFTTGEIPEDATSARNLMATINDYLLEEGILYHLDKGHARSRNVVRQQLVIPRSLKDEVMLAFFAQRNYIRSFSFSTNLS